MIPEVRIPYNVDLAAYDFGPQHPLSPIRTELAMRLCADLGLLDRPNAIQEEDFASATGKDLRRVHTKDYIKHVERASKDPDDADARYGLGTPDTPAFKGMHAAAARVCGATLAGAKAVNSGDAVHAVNLAGGLHHAMPDRGAGFCVYNDSAVAIAWLLDNGVERVAYIDIDVHHGDGVQTIFWDDPRVLTISIHESPETLFPGTGWPTEIGGPRALGTAVNIALPAGTGDQGWLRGLNAVAPPLLAGFKPEFIVSQHGCDGHFEDPLASLTLSVDGLRKATESIHNWAHRYASGKWLATGGGGYEWVDVVPRVWTNVMATALHAPIAPKTELPAEYREYVLQRMGRRGPHTMTDGYEPWPKNWEMGYDPADPVDAAIQATRSAVFPYAGLISESMGGF